MRARLVMSLLVLGGCDGASPELGLEAWMRVAGAQYVPGPPPEDGPGPAVAALDVTTSLIQPGEVGKPVKAALDPGATAALLTLAGDAGHWIVPAGVPEATTPDFPSMQAELSFSKELPLGPHDLVVRAVDQQGQAGTAASYTLDAVAAPAASGLLVVSLDWDTDADLDLHVVDPAGVEIWRGNVNSWTPPPPGEPVDPHAHESGALLDADSNAECVIDGRNQENVAWPVEPPPGRYTVRVDTFSLCATAGAHWHVAVILHGTAIARAEGTSTPIDAGTPHGLGAGQLALEIDVP